MLAKSDPSVQLTRCTEFADGPNFGSSKFYVDYLSVYVLASSHPGQACASTRQRNRSNPARPYMSRLMTLSRLT